MARSKLRVAIVHDWLTTMGGAEPVVLELHKLYPDAPIYTSVYDAAKMTAFAGCDVRTTYLQKLPRSLRYKHVLWPVLRAYAFRKLDLSRYDLIISSSSAEAKSVRKKPGATHICYCHTPTRYYWSHYQEFKKQFNFGFLTPLIRPLIPAFVSWMRRKDIASIKGVDYFIANSEVTKQRIKNYYCRDSAVIHPPVATKRFLSVPNSPDRSGFIVWGRHVPYKRFDLAIAACNQLGVNLVVAGSGPDTPRLKSLADPTISFPGRVSDAELEKLAGQAKYFLFPNEEDFGISAVEALGAGLPVIAYAKGGALDIVQDRETGILFEQQTVASLVAAIKRAQQTNFSINTLRQRSKRFDRILFVSKMKKIIRDYSTERKA